VTIASPSLLVFIVSVIVGLLMVVLFRYTSNQKAIARAKDQLKAHLLAVRLFQDQLQVVGRAYGRILGGTARYLRLAFMPLLIAIVPITFLIVELDRYFGWEPLQPGQAFLLSAKLKTEDAVNSADLQLPAELTATAPAVHDAVDNSVIWRVVAARDGRYNVNIASGGESASKEVLVSSKLVRLSPERVRGSFWKRMFYSTEPALPNDGSIQAISVDYPAREVGVFTWKANWIMWFFFISLIAGFIFKSALGIEV
jgi:uncharacterized membrane protein (DUF106 family)